MNKSYSKMIASGFLTLVSILLVVSVSYAWFTLSGTPALTGVQINIGGTNTIKVAPDITAEVEGETVHYPGAFSDTLDIKEWDSYSYLNNLYGLTPVSTADGLHWFMPSAESHMDVTGEMLLRDYVMDNKLSNGNIQKTEEDAADKGSEGSYAYIDFWMVSPQEDCNVRLSIGDKEEGSYVIGLPRAKEDATAQTGFSLEEEDQLVSSTVRLGFLVNTDEITDNLPMQTYAASEDYSGLYKQLKGIYQEKGETIPSDTDYQFTIYEPNGDLHSSQGVSYIQTQNGLEYVDCNDGDYVVTNPIGYENGKAVIADSPQQLTVQKKNTWKRAENGELMLSQIFQSFLMNQDLDGVSEEEITSLFYQREETESYSGYVERGSFIQNTQELYLAGNDGVTKAKNMKYVGEANTTEQAIIVNLKKNVPQKVRMYVWLEGQDIDCVRETAAEYFAVGIELAGSQHE